MIRYLKNNDLEKEIKNKNIIIDFYADWCTPCILLGEEIKELFDKDKTVEILKINIDEYPNIAEEYKVESIPFLLNIKNGKIVKEQIGLIDEEHLIEFIKR